MKVFCLIYGFWDSMGNPIKEMPSNKKPCIITKLVKVLVSCVYHVFDRCVVNVSSTQHGLLCKVGADEYWWSSASGTGLKAIIILYWNIKYLPFWQHRSYLHDKFWSLSQTAVEKTIDVIHTFKTLIIMRVLFILFTTQFVFTSHSRISSLLPLFLRL